MAMPHGELSVPPEIRCVSRFPAVSNTATYPLPAPATSLNLLASCMAYDTYSLPPIFQMLNGANPAGTIASLNPPATVVALKFVSNTSMLPELKLEAYSSGPVLGLAIARPLYTAPEAELFAWISA